ncbi:hypothetical protein [Paenibacillus chitinolyticus]
MLEDFVSVEAEAAAGTALLGCTVYFPYKHLLARRRLNRSRS